MSVERGLEFDAGALAKLNAKVDRSLLEGIVKARPTSCTKNIDFHIAQILSDAKKAESAKLWNVIGLLYRDPAISADVLRDHMRCALDSFDSKWKTAEEIVRNVVGESQKEYETKSYLSFLKTRMETAARALEFDKAARYRDEIRRIEEKEGVKESVLNKQKTKDQRQKTKTE